MTLIADNFQQVQARIANACAAVGRSPSEVALLAVSKTMHPVAIRQAYAAGITNFGENYLQGSISKIDELADLRGIQWHLIGPLQSNKTRLVAQSFDWVHSVDRYKIAQRLSAQRSENENKLPLNVCIQVNIDSSTTKSGVIPADVVKFAQEILKLPNLVLRGIMTIPDPAPPEKTRAMHALAKSLFCSMKDLSASIDTLSMGMSADLELAILEGSTMVRVGTALFGARPLKS
jgi:pyridoxal phosphate enzyme (YggS family)